MIDLPEMTLTQAIAISIYCSLQLPQSDEYVKWANNWLSGADRSPGAALAARVARWKAWPGKAKRGAEWPTGPAWAARVAWTVAAAAGREPQAESVTWTADAAADAAAKNDVVFDLLLAIKQGMKIK